MVPRPHETAAVFRPPPDGRMYVKLLTDPTGDTDLNQQIGGVIKKHGN